MGEKISDMTAADLPLSRDTEIELSIPGSPRLTRRGRLGDVLKLEAHVNPISATSHQLSTADAGTYMRFTNASAKTLTVQNDADEAYDDDSEYHGRNVGAADLTIVEAGSVTVNPPAGGTLVIPQDGTFTLKRAAVDEFDLIGVTVPA